MANHRPPTKKPKRLLPPGKTLQQVSKLPLELKFLILEALIRRKPPHISAHGLIQHPFLDVTWPVTLRKQIWLLVLHSAPLQTYVHRTLGPVEWLKGNITPGFVRSHDQYCGVAECKNFRITANFLVLEYKPGRFAGLRCWCTQWLTNCSAFGHACAHEIEHVRHEWYPFLDKHLIQRCGFGVNVKEWSASEDPL